MKPLSCRLRRHKWKRVIEHGEEFRVCEECGKQDTGGRTNDPPWTTLSGDKFGGIGGV